MRNFHSHQATPAQNHLAVIASQPYPAKNRTRTMRQVCVTAMAVLLRSFP